MNIINTGKQKFIGYCEERNFPWKRGETVVLPKGTIVRENNGNPKELKRKQSVKIDHFLSGMSICVGHYWSTHDEVSLFYQDRHDPERVKKIYGTDKLEDLWPNIVPRFRDDNHPVISLFLPINNPELVYAGSGGYWKYVDINQLV